MGIVRTGLAAGLLASACGAASALDYREGRDGDLPWQGTHAQLTFDHGTNTVSGRMEAISLPDGTLAIDLDPFDIILPEGAALLRADVEFLYRDTTRNTARFNFGWYILPEQDILCFAFEEPSDDCPSSGHRGGATLFTGAQLAPYGLIVSPGVSWAAEDWSQPYGGRITYRLTFEVGSAPPLGAGSPSPVPEPSTWALMALGVAMLLGAGRSKQPHRATSA